MRESGTAGHQPIFQKHQVAWHVRKMQEEGHQLRVWTQLCSSDGRNGKGWVARPRRAPGSSVKLHMSCVLGVCDLWVLERRKWLRIIVLNLCLGETINDS